MLSTFLGWPYHYKNSLSFPASQVLSLVSHELLWVVGVGSPCQRFAPNSSSTWGAPLSKTVSVEALSFPTLAFKTLPLAASLQWNRDTDFHLPFGKQKNAINMEFEHVEDRVVLTCLPPRHRQGRRRSPRRRSPRRSRSGRRRSPRRSHSR